MSVSPNRVYTNIERVVLQFLRLRSKMDEEEKEKRTFGQMFLYTSTIDVQFWQANVLHPVDGGKSCFYRD